MIEPDLFTCAVVAVYLTAGYLATGILLRARKDQQPLSFKVLASIYAMLMILWGPITVWILQQWIKAVLMGKDKPTIW